MKRCLLTLVILLGSRTALAHHSFAVFFNTDDKVVKVTGVVQSFVFSNPHGVITLAVTDNHGELTVWHAETNSPSLLRRRGWSPDSLTVGSKVTLEGWPARDGTNFMRMRAAWNTDGKLIGQPLGAP